MNESRSVSRRAVAAGVTNMARTRTLPTVLKRDHDGEGEDDQEDLVQQPQIQTQRPSKCTVEGDAVSSRRRTKMVANTIAPTMAVKRRSSPETPRIEPNKKALRSRA
jgi:hypothetical protein